jgi:hypothetical protein
MNLIKLLQNYILLFFKTANNYDSLFFFSCLIIFYSFIGYQDILFLPPQGIHFIRQTDSLSFAMQYFNTGYHFWEPAVFHLDGLDGKAASEFPVLYYLAALFYPFTGPHPVVLKSITLLIVSFGFYYSYLLIRELLKTKFYAFILTFIILNSLVLLYYSNNVVPDSSALGFCFIGCFYFYKGINNSEQNRFLPLSYLFFTLSCLLKITFFIIPFGLLLFFIIFLINKRSINSTKIRTEFFDVFVPFLSMCIICAAWIGFIKEYNFNNNSTLFLTKPHPIWEADSVLLKETWDNITGYWYNSYYDTDIFRFYFLTILVGFIVGILIKSIKVILPGILLCAGISIMILFYSQFRDHDYYFIVLIPVIFLMTVLSLEIVQNVYPGLFQLTIPKIAITGLLIMSVINSKEKLKERYTLKYDQYSISGKTLLNGNKILDSLGVTKNARVILLPEHSPNGGLLMLNRTGWTFPDTGKKSIKEFWYSVKSGGKYLICSDTTLLKNKTINNRIDIKIFENNNYKVYKLIQYP